MTRTKTTVHTALNSRSKAHTAPSTGFNIVVVLSGPETGPGGIVRQEHRTANGIVGTLLRGIDKHEGAYINAPTVGVFGIWVLFEREFGVSRGIPPQKRKNRTGYRKYVAVTRSSGGKQLLFGSHLRFSKMHHSNYYRTLLPVEWLPGRRS